ncbi:hypothetical protein PHLCEN_2v11328 [Hermanssonia centrifuga]|uniref:C3H1-type domain-containing protein n=1 Tax=Hermanssonia centrifuga TaxID=98765 RepID=A0A2R6NKK0_9APHY|nr:hypothetical protein PHLCEN_2v11328 [Hermanssonia centrifuga]
MSPPSGSPPLCVFYLQNACSRGDQCRYSHGPPQSEDHKTASPSPSVLCQFFSEGSCRFGGQCRFYHPADSPNDNVAEVTSWRKPNTSTNNRTGRLLNIGSKNTNPIVSPVMKRSAFGPCKFFSQGRCMKGEACSFTHSALAGHPATPLPLPPDLPAMVRALQLT